MDKKKLNAKDFINIGIFTVIYFVMFFITGMMGYIPNPSEAAVSHDGMTGYRVQGNPHVDDASSASFNSQISGIFKVAGSS